MVQTAHRSPLSGVIVGVSDLKRFASGWILDGKYRQLSVQTLTLRRSTLDKLIWWLDRSDFKECGTFEIRGFISYVANGHTDKQGRWGNKTLTKPVKTRTVKDMHGILRTFFRFLVSEGYLPASPMEGLKPPVHRADQIQPLTEDQVRSLLKAAKRSRHPQRNEALVMFLLDTGVRASELCGISFGNVDIVNRKAVVLGKGNKQRAVFFSRETGRMLWRCLRSREIDQESPLFQSERSEHLTRFGLAQLIERLGHDAKIEAVRCSPHTIRHTFAVMFLRAGGSVFTLKEMLGHTDLAMTNRYVALAQADVQNQHRQFSPVENLKRK